jgi:hypothetical protein
MDVKLCADGSYVGRSGPTCEFDPCPGEEDDEVLQDVQKILDSLDEE